MMDNNKHVFYTKGRQSMKSLMRLPLFIAVLIIGLTGITWAQDNESALTIDPQAESLIHWLGKRSGQIKHFTFKVIDTIDNVTETGQKLQYCHVRLATVSRPNRVRIDSTGDISNRSVWKDDATLTILDRVENVYGQVNAPGSIEQMMDAMVERYGVTTPLADLLSSDIAEVLLKNAKTCRYISLHSVGEISCHHIAATQDNIDWQVWIAAGEKPQLQKIVVTYKQQPGEPQYTAVLQSFTRLETVADDVFAFQPPEGAKRIGFLPLKAVQTKDTAP
jgi:hypothetical protein